MPKTKQTDTNGLTRSRKTKGSQKREIDENRENLKENKDQNDKVRALEKLNQMSKNFLESMGLNVSALNVANPKDDQESDASILESESDSDDVSEEEIIPKDTKVGPKVIIFDPKGLNSKAASKQGFRSFMSSSTKKLDSKPIKIEPESKEEAEEEANNDMFDRELNNLLNDSKLIEKLATSELQGKAKRKHQYQQMVALGSKPMKSHQNPINTRLERVRCQKRKAEKAIDTAKEQGNYHKSIKHLFEGDSKPDKKKKDSSGLRASLGKFTDGVLHISKSHIKRNTLTTKTPQSGRGGKGPKRRK